ncbi:hypothetical protein PF005_g9220 [Phytophthora fragariae]|uniref:Uncharacterized protein n=2 Tax=Phytophthora TaxID=4783 RepID=A0A6A3SIE7_9STRA|nr:hypothetical protein PF003_g18586 [Phytophthora fragariae]KAE9036238.1 hypothetical protein PR002_g7181 [Phytophthora rubi]KAE8945639.1 hypothetical protein PF009_g4710 [Phytophthora fragariae]KAE9013482.1 hypothetical protein PF011_g8463 [Phytophthora fragariae]KAE9048112.1 hypothetical protein PR001_g3940 [Phytophthora rubi]
MAHDTRPSLAFAAPPCYLLCPSRAGTTHASLAATSLIHAHTIVLVRIDDTKDCNRSPI